jgi:hypothetical protein
MKLAESAQQSAAPLQMQHCNPYSLAKEHYFLRDQYALVVIYRAMIMLRRVFLRAKPEHISSDILLRRYTSTGTYL